MSKKSKKQNSIASAPGRLLKFVKEARQELTKVSWPNRQTTIRYTIIVVIASLAVGAITGGVDYLLAIVIEQTI